MKSVMSSFVLVIFVTIKMILLRNLIRMLIALSEILNIYCHFNKNTVIMYIIGDTPVSSSFSLAELLSANSGSSSFV